MSTTTLVRGGPRADPSDETPPDLEIDPRIADRRTAVQREHRRKRRRMLYGLLAFTVVTLTALALTRSPLLDVDHVDVVGADRTAVDDLVAATGIGQGMPMTEVDLDGAREAIAALPWIADVRIERTWPNRIAIAVRERESVAAVPAAAGGWALIDDEGHVLDVRAETSDRWPRIAGVEPAGEPGTAMGDEVAAPITVANALSPDLRNGLDQIVVDDAGRIELHYVTGQRALLGDVDDRDDLHEKLVNLATIQVRVDDCGVDTIDLRATVISTVTRVPTCRAGAEPPPDASTSTETTVDATESTTPVTTPETTP
jgi:cell division protein FtsQ